MRLTEEFGGSLLFHKPVSVQLEGEVLGDHRLKLSCSPTKDVEAKLGPLVYVVVTDAIFVAELFRCTSLA